MHQSRARRVLSSAVALVGTLHGQTVLPAGAQPPSDTPVAMTECEGINNCATWTFLGTQGNGQWPSGEIANLSVEKFTSDSVVIRRADSTGAAAGLTAVYTGTRHDNRVGGEFTSSWPGHWESKTGNWYATLGKASLTPPSVMRYCNPGICGVWTWNGDHYDGVWPGSPKTAVITVASFTPESVVMNRRDNDTGRTFILTGTISKSGDRITNGQQLRVDEGSTASFTATWGAALQSSPPPVTLVPPIVCYPWFFGMVCGR
jgi:hypothetical protein